jgi:hypothetical protein
MKVTLSVIMLFIFISINSSVAQGVGDPAPDFTLNSLDNGTIQLSNYLGKVVFLFFVGYS